MLRPQRIQYENAFYHVMNRGRGRQTIFHSEKYYQAFLQTLDGKELSSAWRTFGGGTLGGYVSSWF